MPFGEKKLGASSRTINNVNKIDQTLALSPASLHKLTWLSYECCSFGLFIYSFLHFNFQLSQKLKWVVRRLSFSL